MIGSFIYALSIFNVPLANIFALLKCLARNVTLSPSVHFSLTGAQMMEAEYVMEIVVKNLPHPAQFRPSGTWFITDAAQYGFSHLRSKWENFVNHRCVE